MRTFTLSGQDTLVHQALLYGSPGEYAELGARCLRDGLLAGDTVVVAAAPDRAALLRERLGPDAGAVEFLPPADWFRGPMSALGLLHDRARAGGWWRHGRLRLLAETVPPPGRSALELREWRRVDSLLNVLLGGTPSMVVCGHDLGEAAAQSPARTHPELLTVRGRRPSERYVDPAEFYAECNAAPLPAPPADRSVSRPFGSGGLPGLREFLHCELRGRQVPGGPALSCVLAANEVATNILRHGGGRGALWLWTEPGGPGEPGELVCDVMDPGRRVADRFIGYPRFGTDGGPIQGGLQGGAGMWAVRRLCHIVEIRSGEMGTVVRLHLRLG